MELWSPHKMVEKRPRYCNEGIRELSNIRSLLVPMQNVYALRSILYEINPLFLVNPLRPEELWGWLRQVAAPALYPDPGEVTNTQRVLLGQARLRQIRSIPGKCICGYCGRICLL